MNKLPTLIRKIDQKIISDYAKVSGDNNPIHLDPLFAKKSQFKGTIAHGMIIAGYFSDFMDRIHGSDWSNGGTLKVKFRSPAKPGDVLSISGKIKNNSAGSASDSLVKYSLQCENQRGESISTATAEIFINH